VCLLNVFINELEREMNGEMTKSTYDTKAVKTKSDCKKLQQIIIVMALICSVMKNGS